MAMGLNQSMTMRPELRQLLTPRMIQSMEILQLPLQELEQRIERANSFAATLPDYNRPTGVPKAYEDHLKLMFDLLVLAFQTDTTRISTFIMAHDGSNRQYPFIGVRDAISRATENTQHISTNVRDQSLAVDNVLRSMTEFGSNVRVTAATLGQGRSRAEMLQQTPAGLGAII